MERRFRGEGAWVGNVADGGGGGAGQNVKGAGKAEVAEGRLVAGPAPHGPCP